MAAHPSISWPRSSTRVFLRPSGRPQSHDYKENGAQRTVWTRQAGFAPHRPLEFFLPSGLLLERLQQVVPCRARLRAEGEREWRQPADGSKTTIDATQYSTMAKRLATLKGSVMSRPVAVR